MSLSEYTVEQLVTIIRAYDRLDYGLVTRQQAAAIRQRAVLIEVELRHRTLNMLPEDSILAVNVPSDVNWGWGNELA